MTPPALRTIAIMLMALLGSVAAWATEPLCGQAFGERMTWLLNRGQFSEAIKAGGQALRLAREAGENQEQVARLVLPMAGAYQAIGQNRAAIEMLGALLGEARDGSEALRATVAGRLANAYLLAGDYDQAQALLRAALQSARQGVELGVTAAILNTQANLYVLRQDYGAALAAYQEGIALGQGVGDQALLARLFANAGRAALLAGDGRAAEGYLLTAQTCHQALPETHDKALGLLNIGKSFGALAAQDPAAGEGHAAKASCMFQDALAVAESIDDQGAISYAAGFLAQTLEPQNQDEAALRLTLLADGAAQRAGMPEALYLWQWQAARILARQGKATDALRAYRNAVATLHGIRNEFEGDCRQYNQEAGKEPLAPLYLGLVDCLLRAADGASDAASATDLLVEAIAGLEAMKSAALRGYYHNTCLVEKRIGFAERDNIPADTAIVYPVPLADRLALIVSLPAGLKKFTVAVGREQLTALVKDFRYHLEKRTSRQYLASGRQLHAWLISPMATELASQGIATLVFVPEGPLRMIPPAALPTGRGFLIEDFAVATIPSLSLTDLGAVERRKASILLAGLSEARAGFAPLPRVVEEVQGVQALYPGRVLLDQAFSVLSLRGALHEQPYAMVHIATHGEFAENASDNFILAWEARLDLDRLEQILKEGRRRQGPIDLLTLSACQSAVSSERAALGLAGLAIKAGVRSALASLWYVNDQASAELMIEFYRQLTGPQPSKAKALQQAQKKLLSAQPYRHPAYWAPFLLIGNWN